MCVGGDGRNAVDGEEVVQVLLERAHVDREIGIEGQQRGGNDAGRHPILEPGSHRIPSSETRSFSWRTAAATRGYCGHHGTILRRRSQTPVAGLAAMSTHGTALSAR